MSGPDETDGTTEPEGSSVGGNVILLPGLGDPANGGGFWQQTGPEAEAPESPEEELAPPPPHLLDAAVEALLFAADRPVTTTQMVEWLGGPRSAEVADALHGIRDRLRRGRGGVRLVQVAKGWQLRTDVRFAPWVAAMRGARPVRLSRAALETLSIVAYRQPVIRSEVEALRGVDSGGVLRMLCERGLVAVTGRKDAPGRPLLYSTTAAFLSLFELRDLSELPTLRDLRELQRDDPRLQGVTPLEADDPEGSEAADEGDWVDGPRPVDDAPQVAAPHPDDAPEAEAVRPGLSLVQAPPTEDP